MDEVVCPVCSGDSSLVLTYEVWAGNRACLSSCQRCSFTFVQDPRWLEGSFNARLNDLDVGAADRSVMVAGFVRALLHSRRLRRLALLDFGGGDGLATRYLRDHGVDCRWEDPFCEPRYFVGEAPSRDAHFDLVFLSEVALHFPDPMSVLGELMTRCDRLLVTAVVPPTPIPEDWWYLMPSTGQHVAFYPIDALREMARQMSVDLVTDGRFFHMFCSKPPSTLEKLCFKSPAFALLRWKLIEISDLARRALGKGRSLTESDQVAIQVGGVS